MPDANHVEWPFFESPHRDLHARLSSWAADNLNDVPDQSDVIDVCRSLVHRLGAAGWLQHVMPHDNAIDVRAIALIRETLAYHAPLADFAFAMQGLGSAPIALFGSELLRDRYLPRVTSGESIAAFAISEEHAGSDIRALQTTALRVPDGWRIDGAKTWISNAGIASFYIVFCRVEGEADGGFAALVVDADAPGLIVEEQIEAIAPHVLGSLRFSDCAVSEDALIGQAGRGLEIALATLDVFRPTVGAAALGMARRALDEAVAWARQRHVFGRPLAEHQLTRARIAQMALDVDASALLVYRAAWAHDTGTERTTREAAMAKLYATEAAQRVIDSAVQLLGGRGVVKGAVVERLYREIRALRIYEGTSEIQQIVIGGEVLGLTSGGRAR
jgi:alkylation response protein AidB-like acyl-CoA dehydrogenase